MLEKDLDWESFVPLKTRSYEKNQERGFQEIVVRYSCLKQNIVRNLQIEKG